MKGDNTITNTFLLIGSILLLLLVVLRIAPIFTQLLSSAALDSSALVSKELAELISVSAAAPNGIYITYNPSNSKYDIVIKDRIVKVDLINKDNQQVKTTSLSKIAVNAISSFNQINIFDIRKVGIINGVAGGGGIGPTGGIPNIEDIISIQAR